MLLKEYFPNLTLQFCNIVGLFIIQFYILVDRLIFSLN